MDPVTKAVLTSWGWRTEVILVLTLVGILYTRGWWLLRKRTHNRHKERKPGQPWPLSAGWRLASYLSGLLVMAFALMSPVDVMGGQLFFMHMIQHLLLIMVTPVLLLVANPMATILWGLPRQLRQPVGRGMSHLLNSESTSRKWIRTATAPGVVWMMWVIVVIGWHDPGMYNWALENEWAHDLEHISFFVVSLLYWWHVTGAGPRIHKQFSLVGRIAFVILAIPPNMLTGMVIAFSTAPLYTYYLDVPRLWHIDVMTDQMWSGVIMWVPGSMMYILAALVLIAQLLNQEERKPALPESKWASGDSLLAPGAKKRK
jgi:cytochrome c oxidase assembly factor CtaG